MKPLACFFLLAYIISWVIWLPLYAPALGWSSVPPLPFHHAMGGLGPLLAAFLTSQWFYGTKATLRLLRQSVQARPLTYIAIALLAPFILAIVAALLYSMTTPQPFTLKGLVQSREFPGFSFTAFLAYNLLSFGFGEETGWRGFALPHLQKRMGALKASLLLTLFWAVWHWPLFLYRPGYTNMDLGGITGWIFSLLTGSVLLTWLFNSSRGSLLVCALFHATIDIVFTNELANTGMAGYIGMLITLWGIAVILVYKPCNLSPRPKCVWQENPASSSNGSHLKEIPGN